VDNIIQALGYGLSGILGAIIGSFMNVCIYRMPRSLSIVFPGSHCPNCNASIRFYDNIPILSYVFLKGRCRHCHERISLRYPIVEAINTTFYLLIFCKYGWTLSTVAFCLFVSLLIVISFIDLDFRIIPDSLSLSGISLGILASLFIREITPIQSILGILSGGGFLFLIAFLYEKIMHKEGMGGGDIKLIAMIGAFIGWQGIPFVILSSSFIGALVGIVFIIVMKKDTKFAIPFGPFLSMGAILYLFFGPSLIHWYLAIGRVGG